MDNTTSNFFPKVLSESISCVSINNGWLFEYNQHDVLTIY